MNSLRIGPWLEPLADGACGPDLEYDPAFMALVQAATGRPETQFGPAEAPSWALVLEESQQLFERCRDLRVAMLWCRAVLHLEGLQALPGALALLHGLLDRFWDELHPRPDPDDAEAFTRLSVLGGLNTLDGLLGDVRKAELVADRRLAGLRLRDVEIALDRLPARADEPAATRAHLEGLLNEAPDLSACLRELCTAALQGLGALQTLMNQRFGIEHATDLKTLRGMLEALQSLLPAPPEAAQQSAAGDGAAAHAGRGAVLASVDSRQDAVRAIRLICAYLERHEPTNPAQLLLRRAERLIDKNFMQLVHDLAPEAVNEVARILGVSPDALGASMG